MSSACGVRTNTGLPRQATVMAMPGVICERSTSIDESARTSADGFMLSMIGHAKAPAADCRGRPGDEL
jgi:hypothetical protein